MSQSLRQQHSQLLEKTVKKLVAVYLKYNGSLHDFLLNALYQEGILKPQYSQHYIESVIEQYSAAIQEETDKIVDKQIEEAYVLGLLMFYKDIGSPISMQEAQRQVRTQGLAAKSKAEIKRLLALTTSNTSKRLKQLVQKKITESMMFTVSGNARQDRLIELFKQTNSIDQFRKQLAKEGFAGIIDKRGHVWKPEVYAKMVLRTKLMEADVALQQAEGAKNDVGLAWISSAHVDNPCNLWEWTLISLNGSVHGLPTYDQAKATGQVFHPNCQHYLNVIRDISQAPIEVIRRTEQKYGIDLSQYLKN